MPTYRHLPNPVRARQFTGGNLDEIQEFVSDRQVEDDYWVKGFNRIGTFLYSEDKNSDDGELWVESIHQWVPVGVGDWVLMNDYGCWTRTDHQFKSTYALEEEFPIVGDTTGEVVDILPPDAPDMRLMGRVRMALLLTRPIGEVDQICERLLDLFKKERLEKHDEDTVRKVHQCIQSQTLGRLTEREVSDVINALQNAGILFRERVSERRSVIHG